MFNSKRSYTLSSKLASSVLSLDSVIISCSKIDLDMFNCSVSKTVKGRNLSFNGFRINTDLSKTL